MTIVVTGLYVYPIKSCRGIPMPRVQMSVHGFRHDREWMVIDRYGNFLTQREHPRMCLIEPRLTDAELIIVAPDMPPLRVPLDREPAAGPVIETRVWDDRAPGIDQGIMASAWFTAYLGVDCALVRMPFAHQRPSRAGLSHVAYADAHQVLMISWASLNDLNAQLPEPVPMDRFRPNVVLSGCTPYQEDGWEDVNVASVRMIGGKRCWRCVITTIDQSTGIGGKEPLRTLATYRKDEKNKIRFGRYFNAMNGGQIDVGSVVELAPKR